MKKLFIVLSLVLLMVSITGCSGANENANINYNNYPGKVIVNNSSENISNEEEKTDTTTEDIHEEIKEEVKQGIKQ